MKKLMFAFVTLFAFGNMAYAYPAARSAQLTVMNLDRNAFVWKYDSGTIIVDEKEGGVTLTLVPTMPQCPPNRYCLQAMPPLVNIHLPIQSVSTDGCGATVFQAGQDQRPVDGPFERIRVTDYTSAWCEYYIAHPTHVVYETISAGMDGPISRTRSTFEGGTLAEAHSEN